MSDAKCLLTGPVLKISGTAAGKAIDLSFELDQGFSDGYTNNIMFAAGLQGLTHPNILLWWGGEFKNLNVGLELAVGVQGILDTPVALENVVLSLFQMALSTEPSGNTKPSVVTISVGKWFSRSGYIKDLAVDWKDPWDIQTRQAHRASVRFVLIADFLIGQKETDYTKLPSSSSFKFKGA